MDQNEMFERFVPKGAASFAVNYSGPPLDFYFLLQPRLTMLAFSAALEPLRVANQVAEKMLFRWFTMTEDGAPIRCSNGVQITPDQKMQQVPREAYAFICAGNDPLKGLSKEVIFWLQRQRAFGGLVGGICTGAFALAKAGLLEDRRFTVHWENAPAFSEYFPFLPPSSGLYENDNGLWTCGGGGAAADMMLDMIEGLHGRDLAVIVSDMCLHPRSQNREAPQKSAYSAALGSRNQKLINAMQMMQDNIEEPMELEYMSEKVGISRRQLERLFKKYVKMTPIQFYNDLRVSRAHALLSETNLSVTEIAMACGYSGVGQLNKNFKQRYASSPSQFRKGWKD